MSAPEAGFPIAACAPCGREVITHLDVDSGGESLRRCVHCDAPLDPAGIRWVSEHDLDGLGYGVRGEGGGCGSGGCGSGGGCSR